MTVRLSSSPPCCHDCGNGTIRSSQCCGMSCFEKSCTLVAAVEPARPLPQTGRAEPRILCAGRSWPPARHVQPRRQRRCRAPPTHSVTLEPVQTCPRVRNAGHDHTSPLCRRHWVATGEFQQPCRGDRRCGKPDCHAHERRLLTVNDAAAAGAQRVAACTAAGAGTQQPVRSCMR
jgi:hypothetical protein